MYKFVLWGYGQRGQRFADNCPKEHIAAVIDQNSDLRRLDGKNFPIISYEEYKQNYSQYDLLITFLDNNEAEKKLRDDRIYHYHFLEDCPPEIAGLYGRKWIEDLPVKIDTKKRYVIYGLNMYAFLLRDYLIEKYDIADLEIVSDSSDELRNENFARKYAFVRKNKIFRANEEILIACVTEDELYLQNNTLHEAFDFFGRILEYAAQDLVEYKNKYLGETCFLIATGPSLAVADLNVLKQNNCKCMAVNKIYLLFENTSWRPDFYVACDTQVIQSSMGEIQRCMVKDKFVCNDYEYFTHENIKNINKFHCHKILHRKKKYKFSEDITSGTYGGGSVLYDCIQIAVYMGFKRLYILGADHSYKNNQSDVSNHFHKDYYARQSNPNKYCPDKVEYAFMSAKRYADAHGIKIYNATRGGKLEIFERVDFDSLFEEKRDADTDCSSCR